MMMQDERERLHLVNIATSDVTLAVLDIIKRDGLTYAEVNRILGTVVADFADRQITRERTERIIRKSLNTHSGD